MNNKGCNRMSFSFIWYDIIYVVELSGIGAEIKSIFIFM